MTIKKILLWKIHNFLDLQLLIPKQILKKNRFNNLKKF